MSSFDKTMRFNFPEEPYDENVKEIEASINLHQIKSINEIDNKQVEGAINNNEEY